MQLQNLSNLITIPNNILQGDIKKAFINTGRLVVNSTVGLLGTVDVANKIGFPKYEKEDYGQTLGKWGVGTRMLFSTTSSWSIYN
jgi:phospholipid-binding lipoprotein MlaA